MASENETIAGIVAVMRHDAELCHDIWLNDPNNNSQSDSICEILNDYARHIEAAWKREREELERYVASKMLDGATIVDNRGNAAAMREALVKCSGIALQWQADEADGVAGTTDKPSARSAAEAVMDMEFEINAALAEPPRNCDVGTAEEQGKRHNAFCRKHFTPDRLGGNCRKCPLKDRRGWSCQLAWAQMPYEAEEGGAK